MELYAGLDLHSRDTYIGIMDKAFNRVFKKRVPNHLEHILQTRAPFQDQIKGFVVESTDDWYRPVDGLMDAGYSSAHLANSCRMESGHANYLIIYKKSSKNGRFLVLSIPFWVQNKRCKDSFWSQKEWFKTILEPILNLN